MLSVIIPTFNRASLLRKAIESVLSQTYQDFQLIIIDDGSEDDTSYVVSGFKESRIKYIRKDRGGVASARNLGIKESVGEFLAFLDSDDWWDKEKLFIQLGEMQKNPSYIVSHTEEIWYKNGRLHNQKKAHKNSHGYIFGL